MCAAARSNESAIGSIPVLHNSDEECVTPRSRADRGICDQPYFVNNNISSGNNLPAADNHRARNICARDVELLTLWKKNTWTNSSPKTRITLR